MNRVVRRNPNEVFLIEGYTDAVGSDVDNLTLSDRRAESVSVVLSEQFEVPFENLTTQGYGEEYLKVETDEAEAANRRVAVRRITPLLAQEQSAAATTTTTVNSAPMTNAAMMTANAIATATAAGASIAIIAMTAIAITNPDSTRCS